MAACGFALVYERRFIRRLSASAKPQAAVFFSSFEHFPLSALP
jgi:hypothetical protein